VLGAYSAPQNSIIVSEGEGEVGAEREGKGTIAENPDYFETNGNSLALPLFTALYKMTVSNGVYMYMKPTRGKTRQLLRLVIFA